MRHSRQDQPDPSQQLTDSNKAHQCGGYVVGPGKILLDRWQWEKGFRQTDKQEQQSKKPLNDPQDDIHRNRSFRSSSVWTRDASKTIHIHMIRFLMNWTKFFSWFD